jgi:hypothetical protein
VIAPFQRKLVSITPPGALVDNASFTVADVDGRGWEYAVINCYLGATDIAMTALKVQESDDDSTYSDISATVFGTADNDTGSTSTLPSATDDNKFFSFFLDLRGRKRYLRLVATNGDGTAGGYMAAWAELWRGADGPRTAAEAGYSQRMVA